MSTTYDQRLSFVVALVLFVEARLLFVLTPLVASQSLLLRCWVWQAEQLKGCREGAPGTSAMLLAVQQEVQAVAAMSTVQ